MKFASVLRISLPLLVLGLGGLALYGLVITRPVPQKKPAADRGVLVQVQPARAGEHQLRLRVQGSVMPAERVVLQSEVAGRIVWQHPDLVPGGRLKKGTTALRVDGRDYRLALEQQAASVERARLEVKVEESRRAVAAREWQILAEDERATVGGRQLALRDPQLEAAQANLRAANSARRVAELAVSKTTIAAPFNAFVQTESVDVGQLVTPQMPLATLVGTDAVWVQVSLPMEHLSAFDVPGFNASQGAGSEARIWQDLGGERVERHGRVIRLLGDLDPVGRLARVLVEIRDPFGLRAAPASGEPVVPLLVGAYVNVELEGHSAPGVFELPRSALRGGDLVYVVDAEERLAMRPVTVAWRRRDTVLVASGLQPGERVVVGRVAAPVAGMLLRVQEPEAARAVGGQPAEVSGTGRAP